MGDAYRAAVAYARAGQATGMAVPRGRQKMANHLSRKHNRSVEGFDSNAMREMHDQAHASQTGVNYGDPMSLRHHHEGVTQQDVQRERILVNQRLGQFNDRRGVR